MIMRRSAPEVSVRMVRKLRAAPQDVYASWTNPKSLGLWLIEDGETVKALALDVRAGGRFRLEGLDRDDNAFSLSGTYLAVIENRHLAFSWDYEGPNPDLSCGPSVVMADFRPLAPGWTELSVIHHLLENHGEQVGRAVSSRPRTPQRRIVQDPRVPASVSHRA